MVGNSGIHVSFILGTYNRAQFLDKILNNVREFILPDDELVVVDGGSTDETFGIISKHKDIVTVFVSEKDNGPAHAYNKALLKSRGRLIMNINDDDYFYPEGVRKAIEAMDEHPEIDALLLGGESMIFNANTGVAELNCYHYLPEHLTLASDVKNFMRHTQAGFLILNRRVIPLAGILDTTIQACDTQYLSQLLLCGANLKYINVKVFRHICYPHSSQNNVDDGYRDRVRILMRFGEWQEILKYSWYNLCCALGLYSGSKHILKDICKVLILMIYVCRFLIVKFSYMVSGAWLKKKNVIEPNWDASLR